MYRFPEKIAEINKDINDILDCCSLEIGARDQLIGKLNAEIETLKRENEILNEKLIKISDRYTNTRRSFKNLRVKFKRLKKEVNNQ